MNPLDLLRRRRPELRPDDHVAAATPAVKPDEGNRPTPAPVTPPQPPQPSQPLPPGQAWPSPRTWLNATVTEVDRAREDRVLARLAALTDQLDSPLAAALAEFAPHLRKDRA